MSATQREGLSSNEIYALIDGAEKRDAKDKEQKVKLWKSQAQQESVAVATAPVTAISTAPAEPEATEPAKDTETKPEPMEGLTIAIALLGFLTWLSGVFEGFAVAAQAILSALRGVEPRLIDKLDIQLRNHAIKHSSETNDLLQSVYKHSKSVIDRWDTDNERFTKIANLAHETAYKMATLALRNNELSTEKAQLERILNAQLRGNDVDCTDMDTYDKLRFLFEISGFQWFTDEELMRQARNRAKAREKALADARSRSAFATIGTSDDMVADNSMTPQQSPQSKYVPPGVYVGEAYTPPHDPIHLQEQDDEEPQLSPEEEWEA